MPLTPIETCLTILAITLGTVITRFTPFLIFPDHKKPPKVIVYLGNVLPPAMMGLLVIYCLRNVTFTNPSDILPEVIAITFIVIIHKWRDNVLLSIGLGTLLYMFLVQFIFI